MAKHLKLTAFFVLLPYVVPNTAQASEEQKTYKLYPTQLEQSELPGRPTANFLKSVESLQILKDQPRSLLAHWRHEYTTNSSGKQQLVKSYFYTNNTVTIYNHRQTKK